MCIGLYVRCSLTLWSPNDHYAPLTSKCCILYIYSTNIGAEYFKHGIYCPFFSLQNAVCFINLTYLVPVLFTFYIEDVLKLKKKNNNSGAKRLILTEYNETWIFLTDCPKIFKYQISWKSVQWGPICSMRTDGRIGMTKLIVAFRSFPKAPKNVTERAQH